MLTIFVSAFFNKPIGIFCHFYINLRPLFHAEIK